VSGTCVSGTGQFNCGRGGACESCGCPTPVCESVDGGGACGCDSNYECVCSLGFSCDKSSGVAGACK
jgi:hypothetical protein